MILNAISVIAGIILSVPLNIYLTLILHNSIRISAMAYIIVMVVFSVVTLFFAYSFMKKYSNSSIVDMIKID